MSCSTTTGFSDMQRADSDSVNLGSNPSPPATEILEKSGDLAAGQVGQDSHDTPDGRTRPGTVAVHAELDRIAAAFPDREDVADRIRGARHSLRRIAGGDTSPEIMGALSKRVADLHRVTRERA
jgi:hypothetical protein